ncbi:serine hydrolase domain-containing protein [Paenibacillus harenae]|uniref:CubicO group peptidase (Beta-lactamase class C family) n=1 Tax=Paenibacillus harenae TaxID=306543 RepID=A0ABT9U5N6_PAEHA|nr:serine hydrolase domain-containing protein [Paenibacillus harenae]MDQ0113995.1 CubicO group peptidase (beta-lactamase class C family) [Paenibacillus harenae]
MKITTETFDLDYWKKRLDELRKIYYVPGASLAVLVDGEIKALACGLLHQGTGVEATTDSLFQIGSISKVYTAVLVMQLVDSGELDLDASVKDVIPELTVPGTEAITIRQLLCHSSGLTSDFTIDTGRGDDCLARYIEACNGLRLESSPGTVVSYSSLGYNVLGRIVEVVTNQTWDDALRDRLLVPLGLAGTVTLPEEVLRFRAAMGHLAGGVGQIPEPAPFWNLLPRSSGPSGGALCATAADLILFAQMNLNGGLAPDNTRLLASKSVAAMQRLAAETPDKWTSGNIGWGLGWMIYDWNGVPVFGHDGATIGQNGYLRIVPGSGVAIALLTNGGCTDLLQSILFRELFEEIAGVRIPDASFEPAPQPPMVDVTPFVGIYKREGVVITITENNGILHLIYEISDGRKDPSPPLEMELIPVSETVFAGVIAGQDRIPVVFSTLTDGSVYCYIGMRAAPKITLSGQSAEVN